MLAHQLALPLSSIDTLRGTLTLTQIALQRHVVPLVLSGRMKAIVGAWSSGRVILGFSTPRSQSYDTYRAMRRVDELFRAAPGTDEWLRLGNGR